MKRTLAYLLTAILLCACAATPPRHDLVDRAVQAMGGADTLARVRTLHITGTLKQFDPEQAFAPAGEPKHTNDSDFAITTDVAAQSSRVDWVKRFKYPFVVTRSFGEIVTPQAGYVLGIDSLERTRQSLQNDPPAHSMSGLRLGATQRELRRTSPLLMLEMRDNPALVQASPDITVGGVAYRAVAYHGSAALYTVLFDRTSGLPVRIRTQDYDNIWGDVDLDVVLDEWRSVDGIRYAARQRYELNGRLLQETSITALRINAAVGADAFVPPPAIRAGAAAPVTGRVHHQWVLRRQFIGTYLDADGVSFDEREPQGLRLVELAPGVHQQIGGSHNTLLVEMNDHLVLFDAPVNDGQSNWILQATRQRYPSKPIRYVVLTHHHMDHAGGLRAFMAQGATLVVGRGLASHFSRVLAAPFTRNPDLAARDLSASPIIEVAGRHVFRDARREVSVHRLDNTHAEGLLIGYVADARIGWVTDLWAPGRPLPPAMNPNLQALVDGVAKAGIAPLQFAGGHGSVAPYASLLSFAER